MMKKIYLALLAWGFAFGANAQNYTYVLDSSFNEKGFKIIESNKGLNVTMKACHLNDDETIFLVGDVGSPSSHYNAWMKFKANGDIDSTLCGSYCISTIAVSGSNYDIHKVQGDYYIPNTGFGGTVMYGENPTTIDDQTYNPNSIHMISSAMLNDSIIVEAGNESGPAVFVYNVRAAGSGYQGWNNHFSGTDYAHGDYIQLPGAGDVLIKAVGVQSDEKILIAGSYKVDSTFDVFVARFNYGTLDLDSTFGDNGVFRIVGTNSFSANVNSMLITADDAIYLNYLKGVQTGSGTSFLAKLNPNGGFSNFGNSGLAEPIYAGSYAKMILGIDNRIYVTETGNRVSYCINADGSFATEAFFGSELYLTTESWLPNSENYTVNMKDVKTNANGDLLFVGSIDSSGVENGFIVKMVRQLVTTTGIQDIKENISVSIYPNPASSSLFFESEENITNVAVFNALGSLQNTALFSTNSLDISQLQAGVYFAKFTNAEGVASTQKFIKK